MIITKKITLEHTKLDSDIDKHILVKIKKIYENKFTKSYGYITDVIRLVSIDDNSISSSDLNCVFVVSFEIQTLKPEVGMDIVGNVLNVFPYGILLQTKSEMKLFVPEDKMEGYEYNSMLENYSKGKSKIRRGDDVKIKIIAVKYENKKYECIGEIP